jgi:hypothetical protein
LAPKQGRESQIQNDNQQRQGGQRRLEQEQEYPTLVVESITKKEQIHRRTNPSGLKDILPAPFFDAELCSDWLIGTDKIAHGRKWLCSY